MDVPCIFTNLIYTPINKIFYTCEFLNQDFSESKIISGQHKKSRTDQDVQCVSFENCTVPKLPQGITKIFPNLKAIWIEHSKLEQISKDDLAEYKNLEMFVCIDNKVKYLAGNVFEDFNNLEIISFYENNLKVVEPNILDGLNKLNYVNFWLNINYNALYSSTGATEYSKIMDLKDELFRKFISSESPEIKNFVKRLQLRVQQLKDSNNKLRDEVKVLENSEQILGEKYDKKIVENLELKQELEKSNKQQFLLTDIQNFLNNEKHSDLQIQIDDQNFNVHKFLLAARSYTLAKKILTNPDAENLILTDITVEIFEKVLKFMSTDELPNDEDTNYVQLYGAASMLKIDLMINFAALKVLENITQDNAVEVFFLSNKFKSNEMRQKAFDEIKKAHPEVPDIWIDKPEKVKKFIEVFGKN